MEEKTTEGTVESRVEWNNFEDLRS